MGVGELRIPGRIQDATHHPFPGSQAVSGSGEPDYRCGSVTTQVARALATKYHHFRHSLIAPVPAAAEATGSSQETAWVPSKPWRRVVSWTLSPLLPHHYSATTTTTTTIYQGRKSTAAGAQEVSGSTARQWEHRVALRIGSAVRK